MPQAILQMLAVMEQMAEALEFCGFGEPDNHPANDALAAYKELTK